MSVQLRPLGPNALLKKVGMAYEGRTRETIRIRDGWRDSNLYAILCHEITGDDRVESP